MDLPPLLCGFARTEGDGNQIRVKRQRSYLTKSLGFPSGGTGALSFRGASNTGGPRRHPDLISGLFQPRALGPSVALIGHLLRDVGYPWPRWDW